MAVTGVRGQLEVFYFGAVGSGVLRTILGSDQGVVITRNGGETWSSWYNEPTGQFYHVVTDNRFPYWVYGAQQDSGSAGTPSRGRYRSLNFHD